MKQINAFVINNIHGETMKKYDLTKGEVTKVILSLAIPIMGSSLLQFSYNLVDMLCVGSLGSNAVASIGSSSFFIGLGYSINALVVIGTGIKVAHSIGNKNDLDIKKYINSGILLNLIIGLIYCSVLIFGGKTLISFLKLNNLEVERKAYWYLLLNGPNMIFIFFNTLYSKILNSYGNNKMALKINAVGIVTNIILNPIFIYAFKLGVLGSAIATLISNIILFLVFRYKGRCIFRYDFNISIDIDKIKEIMMLGFPMAFQRVLFTLVNIILARIIAMFGSDAIAAQKIGLQIESIAFMIIGGLSGAVSSFSGQNFGAQKLDRVIEGYKSSIMIAVVYSAITTSLFIFCPEFLSKIFIRDINTIKLASGYLKIIAISQVFSAVEMVSNGFFTGVGKPKIPAYISIIFTTLRIPMALLFAKFIGVSGIWLSISLSSVFKGVAAYVLYLIKF